MNKYCFLISILSSLNRFDGAKVVTFWISVRTQLPFCYFLCYFLDINQKSIDFQLYKIQKEKCKKIRSTHRALLIRLFLTPKIRSKSSELR